MCEILIDSYPARHPMISHDIEILPPCLQKKPDFFLFQLPLSLVKSPLSSVNRPEKTPPWCLRRRAVLNCTQGNRFSKESRAGDGRIGGLKRQLWDQHSYLISLSMCIYIYMYVYNILYIFRMWMLSHQSEKIYTARLASPWVKWPLDNPKTGRTHSDAMAVAEDSNCLHSPQPAMNRQIKLAWRAREKREVLKVCMC